MNGMNLNDETVRRLRGLIEIGVQVNGKARGVVALPADVSKEDAIAAAKAVVADKITGNIVKEIYVPGKIINIVCK